MFNCRVDKHIENRCSWNFVPQKKTVGGSWRSSWCRSSINQEMLRFSVRVMEDWRVGRGSHSAPGYRLDSCPRIRKRTRTSTTRTCLSPFRDELRITTSKNRRSTRRLLDEVDFSRFDGCQGVAVWHGIQEGTFSKLKETLCRHLRMELIHRTLVERRHGALTSDR